MSISISTGTLGHRAGRLPAICAVDRALDGQAVEPHRPLPERLDQLERQRPGAQDARPAVGAERVVDLARCRTC